MASPYKRQHHVTQQLITSPLGSATTRHTSTYRFADPIVHPPSGLTSFITLPPPSQNITTLPVHFSTYHRHSVAHTVSLGPESQRSPAASRYRTVLRSYDKPTVEHDLSSRSSSGPLVRQRATYGSSARSSSTLDHLTQAATPSRQPTPTYQDATLQAIERRQRHRLNQNFLNDADSHEDDSASCAVAETLTSSLMDLEAQLQREKAELEEIRCLLHHKKCELKGEAILTTTTTTTTAGTSKMKRKPVHTESPHSKGRTVSSTAPNGSIVSISQPVTSTLLSSSHVTPEVSPSGGFLEIVLSGLAGMPYPLYANASTDVLEKLTIEIRVVTSPPVPNDPGFRLRRQTVRQCFKPYSEAQHDHSDVCALMIHHVTLDGVRSDGTCRVTQDTMVRFDLRSLETSPFFVIFLVYCGDPPTTTSTTHSPCPDRMIAWAWISLKVLRDPFKALRLPRDLSLEAFPPSILNDSDDILSPDASSTTQQQQSLALGPRALVHATLSADLRFVKSLPSVRSPLALTDASASPYHSEIPLASMPLLRGRTSRRTAARGTRTRSHVMDPADKPVTLDVAVGPSIPMRLRDGLECGGSFSTPGVHHFHCVKCGQMPGTHLPCHMWVTENGFRLGNAGAPATCLACQKIQGRKTTTERNPLSPSFSVSPTPPDSPEPRTSPAESHTKQHIARSAPRPKPTRRDTLHDAHRRHDEQNITASDDARHEEVSPHPVPVITAADSEPAESGLAHRILVSITSVGLSPARRTRLSILAALGCPGTSLRDVISSSRTVSRQVSDPIIIPPAARPSLLNDTTPSTALLPVNILLELPLLKMHLRSLGVLNSGDVLFTLGAILDDDDDDDTPGQHYYPVIANTTLKAVAFTYKSAATLEQSCDTLEVFEPEQSGQLCFRIAITTV